MKEIKMQAPAIFNEYISLERLVEVINNGGTAMCDENEIAGYYAYDAAELDGFFTVEDVLAAHLDFLAKAGAEFHKAKALKIAMEFAESAE